MRQFPPVAASRRSLWYLRPIYGVVMPGSGRKVQQALDDARPPIPHDEMEAQFAKRRAAASRKVGEGDA